MFTCLGIFEQFIFFNIKPDKYTYMLVIGVDNIYDSIYFRQ